MSLFRYLLIIVLFILIIKVLQGLARTGRPGVAGPPPSGVRGEGETEELVRDPHCGVFFPRAEGVASWVDGKLLYFHEARCRDEYLKAQRGRDTGGSS
ncbi:MAG: hypothetical protein AB1896_02445 [Thermodesulfobacteriota bacterium]